MPHIFLVLGLKSYIYYKDYTVKLKILRIGDISRAQLLEMLRARLPFYSQGRKCHRGLNTFPVKLEQ